MTYLFLTLNSSAQTPLNNSALEFGSSKRLSQPKITPTSSANNGVSSDSAPWNMLKQQFEQDSSRRHSPRASESSEQGPFRGAAPVRIVHWRAPLLLQACFPPQAAPNFPHLLLHRPSLGTVQEPVQTQQIPTLQFMALACQPTLLICGIGD